MVGTVDNSGAAVQIALTADGTTLYSMTSLDKILSVTSTADFASTTGPTFASPAGVVLSPGGGRYAWVPNTDGTITVLDTTADNAVVAKVATVCP